MNKNRKLPLGFPKPVHLLGSGCQPAVAAESGRVSIRTVAPTVELCVIADDPRHA